MYRAGCWDLGLGDESGGVSEDRQDRAAMATYELL